jgi:hypothetical protein
MNEIKSLMKNGVVFNDNTKDDILETVQEIFPNLYKGISEAIERQEVTGNNSITEEQDEDETVQIDKTEIVDELETPEKEMVSSFIEAVKNGDAPWQKEQKAGCPEVPFNPVSGEVYQRNNLIAITLHQLKIKSGDPRYLKAEDIEKYNNVLKDDAIPIKLLFRTADKNGEYVLKTETLYNAGDIIDAPKYTAEIKANIEDCITAKPARTAEEQMLNEMAAFMAALDSGSSYKPAATQFKSEDYGFIDELTANKVFSMIQNADSLKHCYIKEDDLSENRKDFSEQKTRAAAAMAYS